MHQGAPAAVAVSSAAVPLAEKRAGPPNRDAKYSHKDDNGKQSTVPGPRPLLTPSIVDQATIIVPPPYVPDPNDPEDPNGPDDPNDPDSACANGNSIVIKLNTEDGPIDDWCNDASFTYWVKEQ